MEIEQILDCIGAYKEDKAYIILVRDAVIEELEGLIPYLDKKKLSARQQLIILTYIQHFYDNKELFENYKTYMKQSINSMLLNEMYKGGV